MTFRIRTIVACILAAYLLRFRYDWKFRRRQVQSLVQTAVGQWFVLKFTRVSLGYLLPPILLNFHFRWPTNYAQDGVRYFDHVKYVHQTRYGPHPREVLDELHPGRFSS